MGRASEDQADRARDSKAVALRWPQGQRTAEIRPGDHASAEQHARTTSDQAMTCAVSQARDGRQGASPTVTAPPEEAADGTAVSTGLEESKPPKGALRQVAHGKDVKGRERRTADTILHILQDRGKRKLPLDDAQTGDAALDENMISRQRKSIPLCKKCHDAIHHHRPTSTRQGNRRAG
jgi:AI2M/AI1M-like, HNH endonuclease